MEKKLRTLANVDDEKLADAVLASAQQIWQAGLGAFSIAEQEGGKVFAKLVKEGTDMQKRTRKLAEIKVSGVTESMAKMAGNVSKQASGSWDKIEQVFEDRVSRTLANLGVPSSKDIQDLTKKIEELTHTVTTLTKNNIVATKTTGINTGKTRTAVKALPKEVIRKPTDNSAVGVKNKIKPVIAKKRTVKTVLANEK